jgi:hypothetical protein
MLDVKEEVFIRSTVVEEDWSGQVHDDVEH